jgi:hypothetical protein
VPQGGSAPGDFDVGGAAARCVVRDPGTKQYFMYYEAVGAGGSRSVGCAVSADGLSGWRRHAEPVLVAAAEEAAWDGGGVGTPCAVSMAAGRWRLYYSGRPAGRWAAPPGAPAALWHPRLSAALPRAAAELRRLPLCCAATLGVA